MLLRLLLLFIVVPFVELALLLKIADMTSWQHTLLLVIVTGVVGTLLARSQGFRTYQEIQRALAEGRMPTDSLIDAVLIFVAGGLLLTPGILTDLFGLSLLIPWTRRFFRRALIRWLKSHFKIHTSFPNGPAPGGRTEVIDSYVVEDHTNRDAEH